jgi:hypothetical protein
MSNNFKKIIDRQLWVQVAPAPTAHQGGTCITSDLRNDISRNPFIYYLLTGSILHKYNVIQKGWGLCVNPSLNSVNAGSACVFVPSLGLNGSIGAGCSTTKIITTTAINPVGFNMLANRGGSGDYGFKIRIIGNSAGGSGKVEERWIIGNTVGSTPTLLLDSALTFTPANGDTYEILGGRVLMLGAGAIGANTWKSFEVSTNNVVGLSQTNLPATIATDSSLIALDEQYVPYNHLPGEGFIKGASKYDGVTKGCLLATASAAGTITGQAAAGDFSVLANEYRNFQIRIVEDTAIPTAVNQRRIIASHTAGASPVYTLGTNWTVTPSANAKFVIENPNLILLWSSTTSTTYTYNYGPVTINNGTNSIASNAWHTSYFGTRGGAVGAGCTSFISSGIQPDSDRNSKHSFIYSFRGGNSAILETLDISAAISGAWVSSVTYDGNGMIAFNTGTVGENALADQEGRFGYINAYVASAVSQIFRFDVKNRVLSPVTPTDWIQTGAAAVGNRITSITAIDGTDKYSVIFLQAHFSTVCQEMIVQV